MLKSVFYPAVAMALVLLVIWLIHKTTTKSRKETKRNKKKPPNAYETMPYYFPTEQVDIVKKMKPKRRRKKR